MNCKRYEIKFKSNYCSLFGNKNMISNKALLYFSILLIPFVACISCGIGENIAPVTLETLNAVGLLYSFSLS